MPVYIQMVCFCNCPVNPAGVEFFHKSYTNKHSQGPPHTDTQTNMQTNPGKPTWGGKQRTAGNVSTVHGGQWHPSYDRKHEFRENKVVPLKIHADSLCRHHHNRDFHWRAPTAHKEKTVKSCWNFVFIAVWGWVMHFEGCLWKPVEGWMCGSLRPGDVSPTVETYKYLTSNRKNSHWIQTTPIYGKACMWFTYCY